MQKAEVDNKEDEHFRNQWGQEQTSVQFLHQTSQS